MSFMRADTACTLSSRKWSTDELGEGLKQIIADGGLDLPEDPAELEELPRGRAKLNLNILMPLKHYHQKRSLQKPCKWWDDSKYLAPNTTQT